MAFLMLFVMWLGLVFISAVFSGFIVSYGWNHSLHLMYPTIFVTLDWTKAFWLSVVCQMLFKASVSASNSSKN